MAAPPPPQGLPPAPPLLPPGFYQQPGQNPVVYTPKDQAFIDTQKNAGYAHKLYRTTGSSVINRTNQVHVAGLQNWTQPVAGAPAFPLPDPRSQAARQQLAASIRNRGMGANRGGFNGGLPPRPPAPDRRNIQRDMNDARRWLASVNMSFVKQLSWDRDGTTTLWHWRNPALNAGNVVLWAAVDNDSAFFNVDGILTDLSRSPHILQRAPLSQHLAPPGASAAQQAVADSLEFDLGFFIWTEWTRYGDLGNWIARVSRQNETFPRSVLWRLFNCLIDACVAMAFPPRLQLVPNGARYGQELDERIPRNPVANGFRNLVHMALSPSNILIDDFYRPTHIRVPRLKVGGFEYSHYSDELGGPNFMPTPNDFSELTHLWTKGRLHEREGWYLPEHFSAEWDRVNYEPYNEGITDVATGGGAAGSFTPKSNTFQIAMNIFCCMLLQQPERPPRATPIPRSGPNMGAQGWTYTGEMRFREYHTQFGRELCNLVSDCCKHMPYDRPHLGQVRQRVRDGRQRNPMTPADIQWVQNTIRAPGAPPLLNPQPGTQAPGARVNLLWR